MTNDIQVIMEKRANQLAFVYLTRRPDVAVTPAPRDTDVDLLVTLPGSANGTKRVFGVETKGSLFGKQIHHEGNEFVLSGVQLPSPPDNTPYPVCLFVFTMENDEGYWKWLLKPDTDDQLHNRLLSNQEMIFHKLGTSEISNIVESVMRWYETDH